MAIVLAKFSAVSPARLAAFEILRRVEDTGSFASILLADRATELSAPDRALAHELVLGVLRWQLWLGRLIEHYANRKLSSVDPTIQTILNLGLYQLRLLSRIPASAAVNESVNLVRRARLRSAEGFVNAVLRRAKREPDYDPVAEVLDPVERLAVKTSHPPWLIQRWTKNFGTEETERLAVANNQPAPVAFRVVNARSNRLEVVNRLRAAGANVQASRVAKEGWRVAGAPDVVWELAREARIYLQDEASQLVVEVVGARPEDRILDLCAAPGSKATQIAEQLTQGRIIAADLYGHRLKIVEQTSRQQQLARISCLLLDASQSLPFPEESFDRVLLDAPCSGTGTLRRNPEIKWRISPHDIGDLATRQKLFLAKAARVVKPGGWLVYSTCSVEPEENEHLITDFLGRESGFQMAKPPVDASLITTFGAIRTWPHRQGTDGFFIAAFSRQRL
ncbi:MAG TPA: 16S rRNA (cytosine(967)-C(5))-methyltransferase RsmB [Pyrinomonadaceae bacterium]|nr:16S rRNA (cytosine(967)-C(5))-methyltransferase RsmB [Pyrinomonadaceae bacterium]